MEIIKPRMMSREDAAAYLGLSARQLLRREQAGLLQRLKPGLGGEHLNGPTYYLTEDLDALIDAAIEAGKGKGARPKGPGAKR